MTSVDDEPFTVPAAWAISFRLRRPAGIPARWPDTPQPVIRISVCGQQTFRALVVEALQRLGIQQPTDAASRSSSSGVRTSSVRTGPWQCDVGRAGHGPFSRALEAPTVTPFASPGLRALNVRRGRRSLPAPRHRTGSVKRNRRRHQNRFSARDLPAQLRHECFRDTAGSYWAVLSMRRPTFDRRAEVGNAAEIGCADHRQCGAVAFLDRSSFDRRRRAEWRSRLRQCAGVAAVLIRWTRICQGTAGRSQVSTSTSVQGRQRA